MSENRKARREKLRPAHKPRRMDAAEVRAFIEEQTKAKKP